MQLYTLLRQEKQSPLSECLECCLNLKTNSISCHWTHFHRDEIPCPRSHGLPGREEERSQIWKKYLPTMQEALVYTEEKIKLVSNDPSKPKTRLGANRPFFFSQNLKPVFPYEPESGLQLLLPVLAQAQCEKHSRMVCSEEVSGVQWCMRPLCWSHEVSRERVCPGRRVWLSLPWGCYYTSLL